MANNELIVGEPRLGWLIDGNPDTPETTVMLQDTGSVVELRIPLQGMLREDGPYAQWWSSLTIHADDPKQTKYSYTPPRVMLFHDDRGVVVLVGCRAGGARQTLDAGYGVIVANYAVLGGRSPKYDKINGMRSDIPAMAAWTGITSMAVKPNNDAEGLLESVQVELKRLAPIPVSRTLNLAIHPLWEARLPRTAFSARERIMLGTMVKDARSWEEHLKVHGAMWDLVSIAAWKPFSVARLEVCRSDDLSRTSRGMTERWSRVVTHRLPQYSDDDSRKLSFLFWYDNIGARGVKHWMHLREEYTDAFDPFLSILRSDDPWNDTNVVQIGIVLEKLGYLIDIKKNEGAHLNRQNQLSFMEALQVILDDMPVTPFVGDDESENEVHENESSVDDTSDAWKRNIRAAYMGLKHADRTMPDSLDLINALRKSILVVRFWVAHQLGVHENVLKEGRKYAPLSKPFIGID
nr:HEPN domain-containing protein [Actinomyces naeslundii]